MVPVLCVMVAVRRTKSVFPWTGPEGSVRVLTTPPKTASNTVSLVSTYAYLQPLIKSEPLKNVDSQTLYIGQDYVVIQWNL